MSGHGGHESGVEACHHAAEHYDHAMHNLSTHAGQAADYAFGNTHHHPSVGDFVRDTGNAVAAQQEMSTVCQSSGGVGE